MTDTLRAKAERNALPAVGPRFFRDGDVVMFEFVIDTANVIGPRPATVADVRKHGEAFQAEAREGGSFTAAQMAAIGFEVVQAQPGPDLIESKPVAVAGEVAEHRLYPDREELVFNGADPAKFDHDGDGKPGGSRPKLADLVAGMAENRRGEINTGPAVGREFPNEEPPVATVTQVPPRSPRRSRGRG